MFKYKPDKVKNQVKTCTLDETHRNYMKTFESERMSIDVKKKKLTDLKSKLEKLNSSKQSELSVEDMDMKVKIKNEIETLTNCLDDISHNTSELDYYGKTDDILLTYYDMIDNKSTNNKSTNNKSTDVTTTNLSSLSCEPQQKKRSKHSTCNTENIMEYFDKPQPVSNKSDSEIDDKSKRVSPESVMTCPTQKCLLPRNRAYLREQYMKSINKGTTSHDINTSKYCEKCHMERILVQSDGLYVCSKCGDAENVLIESDVPNYKDSVSEKPVYNYKRTNHLTEWLNQIQAKETTDIPPKVYDSIRAELKRSRVKNIQNISNSDMKAVLKKLKLQQYYEHIPHIISKITGKHPPTLSREIEDKIKQMFKDTQEPFQKYCPKGRTNFLSYSYTLHKLFQILKLDEFTEYFQLLKSREKLRLQDELWKKICADLGYEFYPSI